MSTIAHPAPLTLPTPAGVYRLTVDQYDRMVQDGKLSDHDRVELLAGVLVRKMPKNPDHVWAATEIEEVLTACRSEHWHIRKEDPVRIPDYDEPEPDLAIVRGKCALVSRNAPRAKRHRSDRRGRKFSLADDQGVRLERYARAEIPVYWIVNLRDRQVEVYTDPDAAAGLFRHAVIYGQDEQVPVMIDGREKRSCSLAICCQVG